MCVSRAFAFFIISFRAIVWICTFTDHTIHPKLRSKVPNLAVTSQQVALLGHFNAQGLGPSVQNFVSKNLVVDPNAGTDDQAEPVSVRPEGGKPCNLHNIPKLGVNVQTRSSNSSDGIEILVRTSPGVEYIKVRAIFSISDSRSTAVPSFLLAYAIYPMPAILIAFLSSK